MQQLFVNLEILQNQWKNQLKLLELVSFISSATVKQSFFARGVGPPSPQQIIFSSLHLTHSPSLGKYPYIMVKHSSSRDESDSTISDLSETLVQFGTVAAGFSAEKTIHLHNLSSVNASFQVLQPSSISNFEKVFSCSQYHGIIAPQSTAKIKVCV
jgi:hypothetical protein